MRGGGAGNTLCFRKVANRGRPTVTIRTHVWISTGTRCPPSQPPTLKLSFGDVSYPGFFQPRDRVEPHNPFVPFCPEIGSRHAPEPPSGEPPPKSLMLTSPIIPDANLATPTSPQNHRMRSPGVQSGESSPTRTTPPWWNSRPPRGDEKGKPSISRFCLPTLD